MDNPVPNREQPSSIRVAGGPANRLFRKDAKIIRRLGPVLLFDKNATRIPCREMRHSSQFVDLGAYCER
jgi:hypothetical protein